MPAAPEASIRLTRIARVLFGLCVIGVSWASLAPPSQLPQGIFGWDKVLHAGGYVLVGALAVASGLPWLAAFLAASALGLGLEFAQGWTGYRSFEWLDLAADALGAAVGVAIAVRVVGPWHAWLHTRAHERKRARRRERRARESRAPERPMNQAKAAARSGPPRWQQVAERQGRKCWLCGTRVYVEDSRRRPDGTSVEGATYPVVDFVLPPESGGSFANENVRLAHRACRDGRARNPKLERFTAPRRTYVD